MIIEKEIIVLNNTNSNNTSDTIFTAEFWIQVLKTISMAS